MTIFETEAAKVAAEACGSGGRETIAVAKYIKKSLKQGQADRFPELKKEIEEKRKDLTRGVVYPDQTSEAYKDVCCEEANKHLGKNLSAAKRSVFLQRVIRPFSAVLWVAGCAAPRVAGFTAEIKPRVDARPKVIQPFPVCARVRIIRL